MNKRRPNSYLMRVFFDAKADEIMDKYLQVDQCKYYEGDGHT